MRRKHGKYARRSFHETSHYKPCEPLSGPCLAFPAGALDYTIAAPGDPEYGDPTSIEPVITADGGAAKNEDRSKIGRASCRERV